MSVSAQKGTMSIKECTYTYIPCVKRVYKCVYVYKMISCQSILLRVNVLLRGLSAYRTTLTTLLIMNPFKVFISFMKKGKKISFSIFRELKIMIAVKAIHSRFSKIKRKKNNEALRSLLSEIHTIKF